MIIGRAIKVDRKHVTSSCGFDGMAGYQEHDVDYGADAKLSFMPKTAKVVKLSELTVEGRGAEIIKSVPSLYIDGMWTFYIKYGE